MPGSLVARNISKSYAAVQVLDRVSLVVSPGDRIGIVGPNGIGKSTLLRVLAGLEEPDRGKLVRSGAVGYLPQEPDTRANETVRDYLARWGHRVQLHYLPTYAPECNPIERVWWHLHEEVTRNHRCRDIEALLDLVFDWLGVRSPFEVETSAYESKAAA